MATDLKKTGVYAITNTVNGKRYIGSSSRSINKRWIEHKTLLRKGVHHSILLQRAWDKYGESVFKFEVLVVCRPYECIIFEQRMIDEFMSCDGSFGYNVAPTAGSRLGTKHSAESRVKMSKWQKGRRLPEWHKNAIKASLSTPSVRSVMCVKRRLRITTQATKDKMSASHKGLVCSKKALSALALGRALFASKRMENARLAWVGRKHTEKTKAIISAARKGYTPSSETKARMSLSHKARWAKIHGKL